jgi:exodeoxyribonuclease VIII
MVQVSSQESVEAPEAVGTVGHGIATVADGTFGTSIASDQHLQGTCTGGSSVPDTAHVDAVIRRGEANADYHARESHRSCSRVKTLLDSAVLYHQRYIAKTLPPFASSATDHGTLLHSWLELGDDFLESLVVPPPNTLTATGLVGKEAEKWAKNEAPAGAVVVSPKERAQILAEVAAIQNNPAAAELLSRVVDHELSVYWESADGHRLKCRFDALTSDGIVLDLKTTREADICCDFWKSVYSFRYHMQDAWYRAGMQAIGLEPKPLHFIVISTSLPHDCQVVTLPAAVVAEGQRLMDKGLAELRLREDLDWWLPETHGEVIELQFPAHVLGRI